MSKDHAAPHRFPEPLADFAPYASSTRVELCRTLEPWWAMIARVGWHARPCDDCSWRPVEYRCCSRFDAVAFRTPRAARAATPASSPAGVPLRPVMAEATSLEAMQASRELAWVDRPAQVAPPRAAEEWEAQSRVVPEAMRGAVQALETEVAPATLRCPVALVLAGGFTIPAIRGRCRRSATVTTSSSP